ncbi:MAG TPA: hypothetical protein VI895_13640 [Bdellovibrionota bacterium]|nr:hypothetical protein [Bdellovibrionota bacterium]
MPKKIPGTDNRVLYVCKLLNRYEVDYLVAGAVAANLHGTLRSTKDIDLLVPKNLENMKRLLDALSELPYGIAKDIDAEEIVHKPFTIVGDDPRVDILTVAGKTTYERARRRKKIRKVSGIPIPYLGLSDLIDSKKTGRPQDEADLQVLIKK